MHGPVDLFLDGDDDDAIEKGGGGGGRGEIRVKPWDCCVLM